MNHDPRRESAQPEGTPSSPPTADWRLPATLGASGVATAFLLQALLTALVPLAGLGGAPRSLLTACFLAGAALGLRSGGSRWRLLRLSPVGSEAAKAIWSLAVIGLAPVILVRSAGFGPTGFPAGSAAFRYALAAVCLIPFGFLATGWIPAILLRGRPDRQQSTRLLARSAGTLLTGVAGGLAIGTYLILPRWGGMGAAATGAVFAVLAATGFGSGKNDRLDPSELVGGSRKVGDLFGLQRFIPGAVLGITAGVWIRILGLLFGPTWRTVSTVGLVIALGLALGSVLTAPTGSRREYKGGNVFLLNLLVAFGLLAGIVFLEPIAGRLAPAFGFSDAGFSLIRMVVTGAFLLPVAAGTGGLLSVLILKGTGDRHCRPVDSPAGVLLGGAVGVLLSSSVLIPGFGSRRLLFFLFLLQMAWTGYTATGWKPAAAIRRVALAAVFLLIGGVGGLLLPAWSPGVLTSGIYRYQEMIARAFPAGNEFLQFRRQHPPDFFREGRNATVAVETVSGPDSGGQFLTVNGTVEDSWGDRTLGPALTGHFGPLLLPGAIESSRVGLLGFGAGVVARSLLLHPIATLTVVEAESAVLDAFPYFHSTAGPILEDPRIRVLRKDLRAGLGFSSDTYDLLVSGGPEAWLLRGGYLSSREFFRQCRRHLAPEGIHLHRVNLAGLTEARLASIIGAFLDAYPEVFGFKLTPRELLVIGTRDPLRFDLPTLKRRLSPKPVEASLGSLGESAVAGLLGRFIGDRQALRAFTGEVASFRDLWVPTLDLPRPIYIDADAGLLQTLDEAGLRITPYITGVEEGDEKILYRLAKTFIGRGAPRLAIDIAEELVRRQGIEESIWIRAQVAFQAADREGAIELWEEILKLNPHHLDSLISLGGYYQDFGLYNAAESYLQTLVEAFSGHALAHYYHGKNLFYLLRDDSAVDELQEVLELGGIRRFPATLYFLGMIAHRNARNQDAVDHLAEFLRRSYQTRQLTLIVAEAHLTLAEAYRRQGDEDRAGEQQQQGEELMERLLMDSPRDAGADS